MRVKSVFSSITAGVHKIPLLFCILKGNYNFICWFLPFPEHCVWLCTWGQMDIDEVYHEVVGEYGPYQKKLFWFLCFSQVSNFHFCLTVQYLCKMCIIIYFYSQSICQGPKSRTLPPANMFQITVGLHMHSQTSRLIIRYAYIVLAWFITVGQKIT